MLAMKKFRPKSEVKNAGINININAGIADDLDCKICLFPFDTNTRCPRMLKECGHTICEQCAGKLWMQGGHYQVTCPFDRIETIVRYKIQSLPKNFTVESILNSKKTEDVKPKQNLIGRCSKDSSHEAWFTCKGCKADFCEDCFNFYHRFCEQSESCNSEKIPSIDKPHQAPKCKTHPSSFADFVCQDSTCEVKDKLVCNTCLLYKHSDHKHVPIEEVVAENQKKLKEELIRETELDNDERYIAESKFENIKNDQEKSLRDHNQLIKQIEDHYDKQRLEAIEKFERQFVENQAMATKVLEEKRTVPGDEEALSKIRDEIRGRLISKKKLEDVEDLVNRHKSARGAMDSKMKSLFSMVTCLRDISFTLPQFAQRVFDPRHPSTSNASEAKT